MSVDSIRTLTVVPTSSVAPDATVKPLRKTYRRLNAVPIWSRFSVPLREGRRR